MQRVGRDIDAASYWKERAESYAAGVSGPYHAHRIRVITRLLDDVEGKRCVDFGCGEGVFLKYLAEEGAEAVGLDPSEELVEIARRRVPAASIAVGGVEALDGAERESVDLLLAANVLAYMTDAEEMRYYEAARRILRPGGVMVVTHSNELFDLYTLNRYTVEFFRAHFGSDAAALLTRPAEPERVTFNVRENPLAYRSKLERYGFDEVQQEFINFHPSPPPLMDPRDLADIDARSYRDTLDWPAGERWKLLFQCSMFGSRSVKRIRL